MSFKNNMIMITQVKERTVFTEQKDHNVLSNSLASPE